MLRMHIASNHIVAGALGVAATALVSILFLGQAHAEPIAATEPEVARASTTYTIPAGRSRTKSTKVAAVPAMLEVHIANNGLVLLRGARVVSLEQSIMHVVVEWGDARITWAVDTDSATKYFGARGERLLDRKPRIGDTVAITGMLVSFAAESEVRAQFVRFQE